MRKTGEKEVYRGKWLTFVESVYHDRNGRKQVWESIRRRQCRRVVVAIPRMKPSGRYVLIRQYRPAVDNYVLEFPAGICESSDAARQAVLELKEETGYSGRVVNVSPPLQVNPASMDLQVQVVDMEIDESAETNINPRPRPEPTEDIEVHVIEKERLEAFILKQLKEGDEISAGVYYFIMKNVNDHT